jgi:hypothetical protein
VSGVHSATSHSKCGWSALAEGDSDAVPCRLAERGFKRAAIGEQVLETRTCHGCLVADSRFVFPISGTPASTAASMAKYSSRKLNADGSRALDTVQLDFPS